MDDVIVGDRYRVVSEPIRGGQAVVYEGRDLGLDRRVAIKFQNFPVLGVDPLNMRARLERERILLGRINHRNVVKILDAGIGPLPGTTAPDHAYIVMDFVEGRTIQRILSAGGMDIGAVEAVAEQLLAGLDALHSQAEPITHRDVNATNVMVDATGTVTLLDLGIAKAASSDNLTSTGSFVGTMKYASPEQLRGLPLDARSDLYSVGCLMYQMLTGTMPFTSNDPAPMLAERQQPPPPPSAVTGVREMEHLDPVVLRALSPLPADRWATATGMREAVQQASLHRRAAPDNRDTQPTEVLAGGQTKVETAQTAPAQIAEGHRRVAEDARRALLDAVHRPRLAYELAVAGHVRELTHTTLRRSLTRGLLIGIAAAVVVGVAVLGAL